MIPCCNLSPGGSNTANTGWVTKKPRPLIEAGAFSVPSNSTRRFASAADNHTAQTQQEQKAQRDERGGFGNWAGICDTDVIQDERARSVEAVKLKNAVRSRRHGRKAELRVREGVGIDYIYSLKPGEGRPEFVGWPAVIVQKK